ncbi:MAG TPA: nucleotide-binding protein [Solirubrobacterales bacterium]|nr:nucleotide-binding protein [Solirubrobacterales bacterium]
MSSQPAIFIGSSTESREYAEALQHVLDHDLITTIWTYGVFLPGGSTLGSLVDRTRTTDFAALFLTPDDEAVIRGEYLKTPRDNVVFEAGLFIGGIGPERAFLLTPREAVELPSDLQGITPITYRTDREDGDLFNAVNPAATAIRSAARRIGPRRLQGSSPESAVAPSPAVLVAIGQLGALAAQAGALLRVNPTAHGRFEVVLIDDTQLGTSVEVDLGDSAAVGAIGQLGQSLTSDPRSADGPPAAS